MKIKSVVVNRFRGYDQPQRVELHDLNVLVGKNDIGKSTLLEALDIFFNEGKGCVKLDKSDINKNCLLNGNDVIEIEVEFCDLPDSIIIDATNKTTLQDEFLLTSEGTLQIVKRYPGAGRERVFIRAHHPTRPTCAELHQRKIAELRSLLAQQGLECADKTKSADLRRAIWNGQDQLDLRECEIEVAKIDAKNIWEQLKSHMPLYTLFQSDRRNTDSDEEVQDPMRIAVKEILEDERIHATLAEVAHIVRDRLKRVAERTLVKLAELNPSIAQSLDPKLPEVENLKWADVFKSVAINGDDDIPINKRGSGVKRLVLISFFRAEAERRHAEAGLTDIVYAIEEPETSQHPEHQRLLIDALTSLSRGDHTQVLITSHSPEIVKRLKFEDIVVVSGGTPERLATILQSELPYPSLNEVNFAAFGEATFEYHNELYGFIEEESQLKAYLEGKPHRDYVRVLRDGSTRSEKITLTEYVRHQIHHPENANNVRFTSDELIESIQAMRTFISSQTARASGVQSDSASGS